MVDEVEKPDSGLLQIVSQCVKTQEEVIRLLLAQNDRLENKLMAKDVNQYQTFLQAEQFRAQQAQAVSASENGFQAPERNEPLTPEEEADLEIRQRMAGLRP